MKKTSKKTSQAKFIKKAPVTTPVLSAAEQAQADTFVKKYGKKVIACYLKENFLKKVSDTDKVILKYLHYFVSQGAGVQVKDGNGWFPLHRAAMYANAKFSKFLLAQGADTNVKDKDGGTPLHVAAVFGNLAVAQWLVSRGADVNTKCKNNVFGGGETPLHNVVPYTDQNHLDVAEFLISKGADVNAKANKGTTPLHYAAIFEDVAIVKLLVSKGADVHAKNDDGKTPLAVARARRRKAIVKYLSERLKTR
jgi:ankyrin repeat protein